MIKKAVVLRTLLLSGWTILWAVLSAISTVITFIPTFDSLRPTLLAVVLPLIPTFLMIAILIRSLTLIVELDRQYEAKTKQHEAKIAGILVGQKSAEPALDMIRPTKERPDERPAISVNPGYFQCRFVLCAGEHQTFRWNEREIKIEIHEIGRTRNLRHHGILAEFGVVASFDTGGGLVFGSEDTRKVATNWYMLPCKTVLSDTEPISVFAWRVSQVEFQIFALHVERVNPTFGEATLVARFVDAKGGPLE